MGFTRQNTVLTMRARSAVSTLTDESVYDGRWDGVYTFGTPVLYIAEKPDLPGNKNFFLDPLARSFFPRLFLPHPVLL